MSDIPARAGVQHDRTRGVRSVVIGALVALLAPLAGFLGGTMVGSSDSRDALDTLFLWLFMGMVIGGIGGVVAIMGGLRWHRANVAHDEDVK